MLDTNATPREFTASPPSCRPTRELGREHLEQPRIAPEVGDLSRGDGASTLGVRPRLSLAYLERNSDRPGFATARGNASELRPSTVEAQRAERVLRAVAHA